MSSLVFQFYLISCRGIYRYQLPKMRRSPSPTCLDLIDIFSKSAVDGLQRYFPEGVKTRSGLILEMIETGVALSFI